MKIMEDTFPPRLDKKKLVVVLLGFFLLFVFLFSAIMICPVSHDEHLYVTAGILNQDYTLYIDFGYLQTPYLPILYSSCFNVLGTTYYLLVAKILCFLFMTVSAVFVYLILFRITMDLYGSMGLFLLFMLDNIILLTAGYSTASVMPMAFSLLAFYLFMEGVTSEKISLLFVFGCGFALAISAGTKLYYCSFFPPYVLTALFFPRRVSFRERVLRGTVPLVLGITVGSIPVLLYLFHDREAFVFHNWGYHTLNTAWRESIGYTRSMSIPGKIAYVLGWMATPSALVLMAGFLFLVFKNCNESKTCQLRSWIVSTPLAPLALLLILFSTFAIFLATPIWPYYLSLPIPYMIILMGVLFGRLSIGNRTQCKRLLVCMVLCLVLADKGRFFKYFLYLPETDRWSGIAVHRTACKIREALSPIGEGEKMATLSPLYAAEAGISIYRELATGPFLYRIGDLMPESKINQFQTTSPRTLFHLLDQDPPRAILVGLQKEYGLESPFIEYAEKNNYQLLPEDFDKLSLYVRDGSNRR
jgi:hypothetical protein